MFNIWNRKNEGLESALFGMAQGQVYCGVFQDTKLTKGVYAGDGKRGAERSPWPRHNFYRKVEHFTIKKL